MEEIENIIVRSFSGDITSEEKRILSEWLNESSQNEVYFAQLKNLWQASHSAFDPDEINLEEAKDRVLEGIKPQQERKISIWGWWQRIAAILVLPLIASFAFLLQNRDTSFDAEVIYQEVISPPGACSKIGLADGSTVWLNSKSKLKYPVKFTKGKREVILSGEAYFEVESDKENPFIVTTNALKVQATGTAFNVEAYAVDSIYAVTLTHGKVDVDIKGQNLVNIKPNQRVSYNNKTKTYSVKDASPYKWYAWKEGVLMFRDDPLEYVFKRIGLIYNVDIEVKDKTIASHLYRATFEGESLDEILRLMKMTAPIEYIKEDRIMTPNDSYTKGKIEVYKAK